MRIQHNITAMNSYRNYSANTKTVAKNLEKLSSGYKINRAGDDAAGLAISEKMRAQITGLDTAQKNAKDGISLVQTAEGSLTEVHSMLNRMFELSEQSANGTYDNEVDRANLQKEVGALKTEIDRIADSSNFNGIKLLDGSMTGTVSATDAVLGGTSVTGNDIAASASKFTSDTILADAGTAAETLTITYKDTDGSSKNLQVSYTATSTDTTNADAMKEAMSKDSAVSSLFDVSIAGGKLVLQSKATGANAPTVTGIASTGVDSSGDAVTGDPTAAASVVGAGAGKSFTGVLAAGDSISINGQTFSFVANGDDTATAPKGTVGVEIGADEAGTKANLQNALTAAGVKNVSVSYANGQPLKVTSNGEGLSLQIGDTAQSFDKLNVKIGDMHSAALGISGVDISSQSGASAAMDKIKTAINSVSSTRGDLGALQNRLDHTINNLSVMHENIQDAESTIRDVDVAKEMMSYTKNNILVQSAQAMLAQANQLPQGVLQLLQ